MIGAGGLGSPVALYLAAAGVGHIGIADADAVELSNLQRQIIHTTADLGCMKVESAKRELKVYRYQKPGKRGIMSRDKVSWYNRIDIGIFLLILEVCMAHEGLAY